jgi:hypothetical protein
MSLVTGTARTGEAAAVAEAPLFNGIPLIIGVLAINTFYVCVRIYEQVFGQFAGLDSFAPEFTTSNCWNGARQWFRPARGSVWSKSARQFCSYAVW